MPDPADSTLVSKTTNNVDSVTSAPHGARQSPIGMAHAPESMLREKESVSGAASPALDGACATSTPIRPGAVGVRLYVISLLSYA